MDDIFVARIMSTELVTVDPETLVEEAANLMLENDIGSVVVVEDGEAVGILTNTDFVRIVAERQPKDETPVSAYMSTGLSVAHAQDTVREAADLLLDHDIHHLPVVDETEGLIGMVSTKDIAAYVAEVDVPRVR